MSLTEIFDETIEEMEEENLFSLMSGLCEKAERYGIKESNDEKRFLDIIRILLNFASLAVRVQIAKEVLEYKGLPEELYLYFACDEIVIARDFLQPDYLLSDEALLHIAKNTSTDHRMLLVERSELPPDVVQEVMRANETPVIRLMNQNEDVAIFYEYDDYGKDEDKDIWDNDEETQTERENPLDEMMILYADKARFNDVIELLAKTGKLPKETVKNVFSNKDSEPISLLCKSLGMGIEAFEVLIKFRCRRLGQLERLAETSVASYPDIDDEYAKAMLIDLQGQAARLVKARAMA